MLNISARRPAGGRAGGSGGGHARRRSRIGPSSWYARARCDTMYAHPPYTGKMTSAPWLRNASAPLHCTGNQSSTPWLSQSSQLHSLSVPPDIAGRGARTHRAHLLACTRTVTLTRNTIYARTPYTGTITSAPKPRNAGARGSNHRLSGSQLPGPVQPKAHRVTFRRSELERPDRPAASGGPPRQVRGPAARRPAKTPTTERIHCHAAARR